MATTIQHQRQVVRMPITALPQQKYVIPFNKQILQSIIGMITSVVLFLCLLSFCSMQEQDSGVTLVSQIHHVAASSTKTFSTFHGICITCCVIAIAFFSIKFVIQVKKEKTRQ